MERPTWETLGKLSLEQVIGKLNGIFPRWADIIAREQRLNVRAVTSATTLTEADDVVTADTTGGGITITLPPVAGTRGKVYWLVKTNAGANNLTLGGSGAETISGAATVVWNTQWMAKGVVSTGSAWLLLSSS